MINKLLYTLQYHQGLEVFHASLVMSPLSLIQILFKFQLIRINKITCMLTDPFVKFFLGWKDVWKKKKC